MLSLYSECFCVNTNVFLCVFVCSLVFLFVGFSVGRLVPVSLLNTLLCFHSWSIYPVFFWGPSHHMVLETLS